MREKGTGNMPAKSLANEGDSGADRRRSRRRPLVTRVAVKTDKAIFFMDSKDISETGIRVVSEVGIEQGTRLQLVPFFDDVARLFETSGTVVRLEEVADHRAARRADATQADMGIEFDRLGPTELEALLGILRMADAPTTTTVLRA